MVPPSQLTLWEGQSVSACPNPSNSGVWPSLALGAEGGRKELWSSIYQAQTRCSPPATCRGRCVGGTWQASRGRLEREAEQGLSAGLLQAERVSQQYGFCVSPLLFSPFFEMRRVNVLVPGSQPTTLTVSVLDPLHCFYPVPHPFSFLKKHGCQCLRASFCLMVLLQTIILYTMCIFVCAYMCVHVCEGEPAPASEHNGDRLGGLFSCSPLCLLSRISYWTWLARQTPGPLVTPPVLALQAHATAPGFSRDSGDPKSGSHTVK